MTFCRLTHQGLRWQPGWKWSSSHPLISLLFCSPPGTACLGPNPPSFLLFLGPPFHNTSCTPTQSDICWWNYIFSWSNTVVCHYDACFWWSQLSEKVLRLRQLTPTVWQQHESQALTEEGRRWCCWLLCHWIFWFKRTILLFCAENLLLLCYCTAREPC